MYFQCGSTCIQLIMCLLILDIQLINIIDMKLFKSLNMYKWNKTFYSIRKSHKLYLLSTVIILSGMYNKIRRKAQNERTVFLFIQNYFDYSVDIYMKDSFVICTYECSRIQLKMCTTRQSIQVILFIMVKAHEGPATLFEYTNSRRIVHKCATDSPK